MSKNKGKLKSQASLTSDAQNLQDAVETEDIVEETEEMEASDDAEVAEAEEVKEEPVKEEETPSKEEEVMESHVNDLLEEAKTPISEEEKNEIIKDVSEFKDAVQKSIQEEKKVEPPVNTSNQSALLATDTKKFFVFIGENMDEDKMRVVEDRLKKSEVDYVVTAIGGVYVGPYEDNAKAIAGRKKIIQKGLKGRIVEKRPSDLGAIATAVDQPND